MVGYDRYSSQAAYEAMEKVYETLCTYVNFFQPVRKLVSKEREGAKVRKRFDVAQTPYQRLLASGALEEAKRSELARIYSRLNPVRLRRRIDERLDALWKLAEQEQPSKTISKAVKRAKEEPDCG